VVIASADLPDRRGFDLVDEIRELPNFGDTPILVYTHRELSKKEELHLKRLRRPRS